MLFTDLVDQTWSFKVSLKSWCMCLISVLASEVSVVQVNDAEMCHVHEKSVSSKLKAKSLVYEISHIWVLYFIWEMAARVLWEEYITINILW